MKKQIFGLITGVLLMLSLFGCGKIRYNIDFDGYGFKSEKTSYAEGEEVTVIYDMIATDTDYSFYTDSDDVKIMTMIMDTSLLLRCRHMMSSSV